VLQKGSGQFNIYQHGDGAHRHESKPNAHKVAAIAHDQHDPIAGSYAQAMENGGSVLHIGVRSGKRKTLTIH
jgi:hypothetical protein